MTDLYQSLFAPASVALVGASGDPQKASSRPLDYLRRSGYAGAVYPINRRGGLVAGEPAFTSVTELPTVPEHAFLMTPTSATLATVRECGAAGVRLLTIMSGGFSERGPEGLELERSLVEVCDHYGMRLLGPNSLGVINTHNGLRLTANAAFAQADLPAGGTFVASQSGSMLGALLSRGSARGLSFAKMVSVGSEADLSVGEICSAAVDDPEVTSFLLFLESMRHTEDLRRFSQAAFAAGKPVVAFKVGQSAVGAELAQSHTGALAGEDSLATAFLADCGITRVYTLDGLVEALPLVARAPLGLSRVGVLTTTGGGAALVVDQLGIRGVDVVGPSPELSERLVAAGAPESSGRIVDVTLAGVRPETMGGVLDELMTTSELDLLVVAIGSSAMLEPSLAVAPVAAAAQRHRRPLAAFVVPEAPDALRALADAGVPAFRTPESCADVIVAALSRTAPRAVAPIALRAGREEQLAEDESHRFLIAAGVPMAAGVSMPADGPMDEVPFEWPVAVKALSPQLLHKTDVGGVELDIASAEDLATAAKRIVADVSRRGGGQHVTRVLVQPMVAGIAEVLIGFRRDPDVGPIVLVAPGGVEAELRRERSIRLTPVDRSQALAMLAELPSLRVLDGYRGRPAGDRAALADAIVAISRLAERPDVIEAEVNPMIVRADGCLGVDAVVRVIVDEVVLDEVVDDQEEVR